MNSRKDDHIKYALDQYNKEGSFEDMEFIHQSIGAVDYNKVDLSGYILGVHHEYPIYINAMTGGTRQGFEINEDLAFIADKTNIMLALGSISPLINEPKLMEEYLILKEKYPKVKLALNIGADKEYEAFEKIIDILQPDYLQVHLNTLQELLMPEGVRDFTRIEENIININRRAKIPVIVKEVGFGMARNTIKNLISMGVEAVDISGRGGTNFALIENQRRKKPLNYLNDWGLTTLESMLEAKPFKNDIKIFASGGIRNGLDIIKCLRLGANAVGISGMILHQLINEGKDETIGIIEGLKEEIKLIMTLLNVGKIQDLKKTQYRLRGQTYDRYKEEIMD